MNNGKKDCSCFVGTILPSIKSFPISINSRVIQTGRPGRALNPDMVFRDSEGARMQGRQADKQTNIFACYLQKKP